jgi:hypothetical protein
MAIEEPAHTVVESEAPVEIRDYRSYVVAKTFVEGAFGSIGTEGFQRLFRYISGDNHGAMKISMTAPVEQEAAPAKIAMTAPVEQQRAGGRWVEKRVRFSRDRAPADLASHVSANAARDDSSVSARRAIARVIPLNMKR